MAKVGARGFTLIEILIVIALFAAGAVVLLQILSMGIYGSVENENTVLATALAQVKMEEMRNVPYASIVPEARTIAGSPYTLFDMEVLVLGAKPNLKQVTVNIYCRQRSGDVKISLVTYVSDVN
ncbi:MAG: type II secretion system protein [Candidatus Omnitrophica bacterium]|nr:type II secretion system protein [Candidatus Omnitrophota bacterium]MDD5310812.1 type II secretion system protein [Candidatus Omnitrophota bacterium]MDD5546803.1 type II secretion system protein [Candidatus Omnitrophota bacterium]